MKIIGVAAILVTAAYLLMYPLPFKIGASILGCEIFIFIGLLIDSRS